jgi:hypothetical protein
MKRKNQMDRNRQRELPLPHASVDSTWFLRPHYRRPTDLRTHAENAIREANATMGQELNAKINVQEMFSDYENTQRQARERARQRLHIEVTEISRLATAQNTDVTRIISASGDIQNTINSLKPREEDLPVHMAFLHGIQESLNDLRTGLYNSDNVVSNLQAVGALAFLRKIKQDQAGDHPTFQVMLQQNAEFSGVIHRTINTLNTALGGNL